MGEAGQVGVYLVDRRSIWRLGLRRALEADREVAVVGEAGDHAEAASDGRLLACDVLLTSWPPQPHGWTQARDLRRVRTLALMREGAEADLGLSALKAGAAACLYDDVAPEELLRAVRFVHEGGCVVDPRLSAAVSAHIHGPDKVAPELTAPETKVATCIARGCTNREIALATGLPERTVVTIISALLQKLGLPTRSAVAAWWIRQGGAPRL